MKWEELPTGIHAYTIDGEDSGEVVDSGPEGIAVYHEDARAWLPWDAARDITEDRLVLVLSADEVDEIQGPMGG